MEPTDLVPLNPVTGEPLPEDGGELYPNDGNDDADTAENAGPDAEG